jgi:predicted nucleotidyltransferase
MKQKVINTKKELLQILQIQKAKILSFGVKDLSIFGSFAKDLNINKESDIDFWLNLRQVKKPLIILLT